MAAREAQGDETWQKTVVTLRRADDLRRLNARCFSLENAMLVGAVVSIFIVMIESEVMWRSDGGAARIGLKIALFIASFGLTLALNARYAILCRIHVETKRLPAGTRFFHPSSRLLWPFLIEAAVCAFHLPFFVADQPLSTEVSESLTVLTHVDQLDVVVLARIYLLGRFLRNAVGIHALARRAHVIPSFHRVDVGSVWFTVKYLFQKRPLLFTCVALVLDWALTATALNFLERGGINHKLTSVSDAVWLTIVTMTSVGYGEIAPVTLGGKLAIALGAIVGGTVIVTCLLRVVLIDSLRITPQEKLVLDVVHFHQYMRQRKQLAATLIQRMWHLYKRTGSAAGVRKRSAKKEKMQVYAAAEALRLLRFTQPPETQGNAFEYRAVATPTTTSSSSTCAALLDTFQQELTVQRAKGVAMFQDTVHLLNMAATSSA